MREYKTVFTIATAQRLNSRYSLRYEDDHLLSDELNHVCDALFTFPKTTEKLHDFKQCLKLIKNIKNDPGQLIKILELLNRHQNERTILFNQKVNHLLTTDYVNFQPTDYYVTSLMCDSHKKLIESGLLEQQIPYLEEIISHLTKTGRNAIYGRNEVILKLIKIYKKHNHKDAKLEKKNDTMCELGEDPYHGELYDFIAECLKLIDATPQYKAQQKLFSHNTGLGKAIIRALQEAEVV